MWSFEGVLAGQELHAQQCIGLSESMHGLQDGPLESACICSVFLKACNWKERDRLPLESCLALQCCSTGVSLLSK